MKVVLVDLDGVVYDGDQAVPGAREALGWLRDRSIPFLFLSNTTSKPRAAIAARLRDMGITADDGEILTPPVAANEWLKAHVDGPVALFVPAATACEFSGVVQAGGGKERVAAVVVGDYGENWDFAELNRAFRLLMQAPEPALVALGMTRYWRAPDGLRLDTGPFVAALSQATGIAPVVLGKPAGPFFQLALTGLGARATDALMIGDDIRTDVDAAQKLGLQGILVKTGKFRSCDLHAGIRPFATLDSLADLPAWWQSEFPRPPPASGVRRRSP